MTFSDDSTDSSSSDDGISHTKSRLKTKTGLLLRRRKQEESKTQNSDTVSSTPATVSGDRADGVRIRDLCTSDKRKIANLVQQLAMVRNNSQLCVQLYWCQFCDFFTVFFDSLFSLVDCFDMFCAFCRSHLHIRKENYFSIVSWILIHHATEWAF